ncbi:hypothetical protein EX30DRAFT_134722 [Ascodesmis nigricans]|uniref:LYR motif-containing protein Cup1-like N-terminal domain-containing protein n=1 Tax=Ascodesmis nigricans TaxID=341454 RepID=A0A4S2MN64_9PEZI|nr:hypothetical protein EX30DRAFT_134722 [Ascodesmis nigricans]
MMNNVVKEQLYFYPRAEGCFRILGSMLRIPSMYNSSGSFRQDHAHAQSMAQIFRDALSPSMQLDVSSPVHPPSQPSLSSPAAPGAMPPPEKPRHLYRHILRQTQILHDDIARGHIARIVRARFETRTTGSYQLRQRVKRGRNFLSTLERANAGVYKPLEKILKLGYGRLGPRWHELMKPVLAHPPTKKPEPLVPDNRRTIPPVMTEPLAMLLKWSGVGRLQPKIPETNIWLQGFSKVREANIRWKHHTHIVSQAKPPIPEEEYQRLEGYATGTMTPDPPRRGAEMVLKMRRKCIEIVNRRAVRPLALEEDDGLGNAKEELTRPVIRERPRDMTSRSWKRHWKALLEEIPVLVYDENRKKWVTQKSDVSKMPAIPVSKEEVEGYEHMEDPREKNRKKVQQKEVRMTRLLAEEESFDERNRDTTPLPTSSRPENDAAQSSPQSTATSAPVTSLLNALAALDPASNPSKNIPSLSYLTPKEPEKAPVTDHFKM